jgi:hypothetical protein
MNLGEFLPLQFENKKTRNLTKEVNDLINENHRTLMK